MLPPIGGKVEAAVLSLRWEAAALTSTVHPLTLAALANLVRVINSYYSNLIEGVRTSPAEIDAAMHGDWSHDPGRITSQRLAAAHVRVEEGINDALKSDPSISVTSSKFLRGLHRGMYEDAPADERIVRSRRGRTSMLIPGELRTERVDVGRHIAPSSDALLPLLARFDEAYRPEHLPEVARVMAFAASHHRLAWIHPFLDGNGRVARLASVAYARKIGLNAGGLWSIARGFARYRDEYYARLADADAPRHSDLDGRGALSLAALEAWCEFVVRVSLDQIVYMRSLLAPATLAERLRGYAVYRATMNPVASGNADNVVWREEAGDLLAVLVTRGEMPRGAALRFLPGKERTKRAALSALLRDRVLASANHRAPIRLAFPPHALAMLFPGLAGNDTVI